MTSAVSSRLKASRSATCSPCGSITVKTWPRSSVMATPERGAISCSIMGSRRGLERAAPFGIDRPPAILPGLGDRAETRQHRVLGPVQLDVAVDDGGTQLLVHALFAQPLELVMQVEHQRGPLEAPGQPARLRMQPDHEERLAAEAEREMRAVRIGADPLVIALAQPGILVREGLHTVPQMPLEFGLAECARTLEQHHEAAEQGLFRLVFAYEIEQLGKYAQIVPGRADVARDH